MSSIVNEFGQPVTSLNKWIPGADRYNGAIPYEPNRLEDFDQLVPMQDWRTVVSVSKRLFVRTGIVKGAVLQRASYAVGNHWLPVFKGSDQKWGREATELLVEEWFPRCDIRGGSNNWHTLLKVDSISMDRDGDLGILLLDLPYPTTQRISSHRIGQRDHFDEVKGGTFSGARIVNGVILDRYDAPIGYRLLGKDAASDRDVPAEFMLHVFDPNWHDQHRGLPLFVHALNDLRSGIYSQNWELLAQMVVSAISLVEYNEYGEADTGNPAIVFGDKAVEGGTTPTAPVYQQMYGGLLRYFKSNSGGKIEQIRQTRPGDMWESFQDRIIRSALAGIPWPYSLVWKTSDLTSVTQRAELLKAQNAIRERQQITLPNARKLVGWAISKFVTMGRLKPNDEWYKWGFTFPPTLSIDPGKDAASNESAFALGSLNMDQIVGERTGDSLENHWRKRAHQVVLKQRIAKEVTEEYGGEFLVTVDDLGRVPVQGGSPPVNGNDDDGPPPPQSPPKRGEREESNNDDT